MIPRSQETQTGRRPLVRVDNSRFKRYSFTRRLPGVQGAKPPASL